MDLYTNIVVATLGATGYAGLQPGDELRQKIINECEGAEKAAKALASPILAKVSPQLTPAQAMKLEIKNVISRIRELVIEEVREEMRDIQLAKTLVDAATEASEPETKSKKRKRVKLPEKSAQDCDNLAPLPAPVVIPSTPSSSPASSTGTQITPTFGSSSKTTRAKISVEPTEAVQCLADNPLYARVNENLRRMASGKQKTIDEFISERHNPMDSGIADALRQTAAVAAENERKLPRTYEADDSDEEEKWNTMINNFHEKIKSGGV